MNNLISKAIQAIQDGKNDYAIGLLEGVLEMNDKPLYATTDPKTPIKMLTPTPQAPILEAMVNNELDEAKIMEASVNMAKIKELSEKSTNA